ncbi:hypothetical protein BC829DRAFT_387766 [Chytridium lagenaria]|nr:hypothetical protein BC829DRAFT_387766 [Chytridium lagenaria]
MMVSNGYADSILNDDNSDNGMRLATEKMEQLQHASSMTAASLLLAQQQECWSAYRSATADSRHSDVLACLSEPCSIYWMSSGVKAVGSHSAVSPILKTLAVQQRELALNIQVVSYTVGRGRLVEEAIFTVVHDAALDWLLPDVKPTRKRITFPVVTIVKFDDYAMIQDVHIHWDQATVLRQIMANSSEVTLPVLGPRIVDPLTQMEPLSVERLSLAEEPMDEAAQHRRMIEHSKRGSMASIISQSKGDAGYERPSSRVLQRPGGKTNDIFNTESTADDSRRFVQQPNHFSEDVPAVAASQASSTADPYSRPSSALGGRRDPNWSNASNTSDDTSSTQQHTGRRTYPNRDSASTAFYGDGSEPAAGLHTGKRSYPNRDNSSISLSSDSQETASAHGTGRRGGYPNRDSSNESFYGNGQDRVAQHTGRRSGYPNRDSSTLSFYGDGHEKSVMPQHTGRRFYPNRDATTFSFGDDSSEVKTTTAKPLKSRVEGMGEVAGVAASAAEGTYGMRNKNEYSVENEARPSTRGFAPPNSNIIFG